MRFTLLLLIGLPLAGCLLDDGQGGEPVETKFTIAVNAALQSESGVDRASHLSEARRLARDGEVLLQFDCLAVASLVYGAPSFDERAARLTIEIFGLMPCPETPNGLTSAARGEWRARTGLLRSTALGVVSRGQRQGLWQATDLAQTVAVAAGEDNELVRAAAIGHLLAASTPEQRPALVAQAAADPSALVRRLLAVAPSEVSDAQP